ncbi:MAG: hypothetical protein NUV98_05780, partial [Candidatus Roizmanbacteria bacterium]|nr:hypothetical protein [Candidatus Roizmanbacteria bacterium]
MEGEIELNPHKEPSFSIISLDTLESHATRMDSNQSESKSKSDFIFEEGSVPPYAKLAWGEGKLLTARFN